jgi:hypothetical protein
MSMYSKEYTAPHINLGNERKRAISFTPGKTEELINGNGIIYLVLACFGFSGAVTSISLQSSMHFYRKKTASSATYQTRSCAD